jgi:pyruvate,water dikinase
VRLAAAARELEAFFGAPQDIEWAVDRERELYILQSRPLVSGKEPDPQGAEFRPEEPPLVTGGRRAAGELCDGVVHHLDPAGRSDIPRGAVLVTRQIPPSLVRHIHRLAGVVCERGAVTGHFATVCREFGVVLLVDATDALELLPAGTEVVVDARAGAVYPGRLPEGVRPAARDASADPYLKKLRGLLDHITPLHLVDPSDASFRPQSCRSLHDIIRYAHEKAMQTMFGLSDLASGKSSRCRLLDTDLAIDIYLLDVGGGFREPGEGETVAVDRVASRPFLALWQGLSHPDVDWDSHLHFDWKGFSDAALSGGVVSGGAKEFASYAIVSGDYCNLNMRFGYHFTLVDCLCGDELRGNYCQLRFAGGGGDYQGRSLRIRLLTLILGRLGFEVNVKADLLDARIGEMDRDSLVELLATVGRLLGATKLLDMVLKDEHQLEPFAAQFFAGAGRFTDRPADDIDPASDTPAHG